MKEHSTLPKWAGPHEGGWRYWRTAVLGWREFMALNPPRVLTYSVLPRVVLQLVFFALLGQLIGGPGQRDYNVVGVLAYNLTAITAVMIADVPAHDKESDTVWRIRTGTLNPFLVLLVRAWPYPMTGLACVLVVFGMIPLLGLGTLAFQLIWFLPCYMLMAFTTAAIGLAGAALAVGKRADVLVGNLAAYLMLLCSGALLPPGRIEWVDRIGSVLPLSHGLAAVRAGMAGRPFAVELLAEATVGAAWLLVAAATVMVLVRRARREGYDHFA